MVMPAVAVALPAFPPFIATCPHGVTYIAEPTGEQHARWTDHDHTVTTERIYATDHHPDYVQHWLTEPPLLGQKHIVTSDEWNDDLTIRTIHEWE